MIEFHQVSKQFSGSSSALSEVSFSVSAGELVFLAGRSGAGKSTLLKMIAAIERPTSGAIYVNGQDISRLKPAALPYLRRRMGLIFQQQQLLPERTVLSNVMMPLTVTGSATADAARRARAALEWVGLLHRASSLPPALSGGEQQRISIARAIVHRPQIILADEPTANLDRESADRVLAALKSFHSVGVTCIISTHDDTFLEHAKRAIYLDNGRVIRDVHLAEAPLSA